MAAVAAAVLPIIDRPHRTLDVPEKQIAVFYGEADYPYHLRTLLVNVGEGRWFWATPTGAVQLLGTPAVQLLAFLDRCRPKG